MNTAYMQWCNENEGRHYPLAEAATCVDNTGLVLPTDILADLHVVVDPTYRDIYVASVWVTPTLLGISISSASGPLASAMVNRTTYQPYTAVALQPMPGTSNMSGWVVFGNYRYTVRMRWLFSGTGQSGVDLRAVKLVADLPVTSLRKLGGAATLYVDKIVKLVGAGYVKVFKHESLDQCIVVELDPSAKSLFMGPCMQLAELGDCGAPPLRQINGVCPDENGIIKLVLS